MREAPWVLSDVLRAKRKNGVEGRKRERSRWLRGEDARRHGRGEGGRERERKEPVCSPPVHILEPHTEASPRDWRRVVGRRATNEAPLPCRLGPLLDDHPETRLMGPVGAPEIPTRTGHNARLKVGFTTDGKAPTDATTFKQGRTVTSPDLLPALPFSLLFPCPSIADTFFMPRSTPPSSIRPHPPLILSNPGYPLVHLPLLTPVLIACARAVPTNDRIVRWPSGALHFWITLQTTTFRESEKIDALEGQNDNDKHRPRHFAQ